MTVHTLRTGEKYDDGMDENKEDPKARKITIGVTSSVKPLPSAEIQADIVRLTVSMQTRRDNIKALKVQIKNQEKEQIELRELVDNPGIYNSEACAVAADRCDKHIKMFEALISKERAGVVQLESMIKTLEERRCLSEMMSQ